MLVKFHAVFKVMPLIIAFLMSQTGYSYKLGQGFTSALEVFTISMLLMVFLWRAVSGKKVFYKSFLDSRLYLYILASLVAVLTAWVLGVDRLNILLEFKSYTLYIAYIFILAAVIKEWRQFDFLVGSILLLSLIPIAYALMGAFNIENPLSERLQTVGWGPLNIYMGYIVPIFFLALCSFFKTQKVWLKGALGIYLGVVTYSAFLSQTRSGWIALAVGILLFTILIRKRIFVAISLFFVVAIFVYAPLGENAHLVARRRIIDETLVDPDRSLRKRFDRWENAWEVFKHYPITGTGWGSFFIPIGKGRLSNRSLPFLPRWHNSYLEILSQAGLFGLISFVWVWYTLLTHSFKEIIKKNGRCQELLIGLTCAVASCLVYAMGEQQFYRIETASLSWFLAGLLVAAVQLNRREREVSIVKIDGGNESAQSNSL